MVGGCLRICHPLMDGRRQITSFLLGGDHLCLDELKDHHSAIEAVTAGIAFLGAGAIFPTRGSVQGLTTGAGDPYRVYGPYLRSWRKQPSLTTRKLGVRSRI